MSSITSMTYHDFLKLPNANPETFCDSVVFVPQPISKSNVIRYAFRKLMSRVFGFDNPEIWEIDGLHDSGYRMIMFAPVVDGEPIGLIRSYSDVVTPDAYNSVFSFEDRGFWKIDCLPVSGLMHFMPPGERMNIEAFTSTAVATNAPKIVVEE